jgi:hypothetical protein
MTRTVATVALAFAFSSCLPAAAAKPNIIFILAWAANAAPPGTKPEPTFTLGFLDPTEMTAEERIEELAGILASAFLRLKKPVHQLWIGKKKEMW